VSLPPSTHGPFKAPVFESVNPATGEVVGTFEIMDGDAVGAVVARARKAAAWWSGLSFAERERHLLTWSAWVWQHRADLVEVLHAENGKPPDDCTLEIVMALEHLRWAARNAARVLRTRRVFPGLLMANHSAAVHRLPLGVVAVIGPWNYPVFTPMGSIGYALAAGNAVVFKPSEYTPAIGAWLVRSFAEALPDAPAGVFALVTGDGTSGAALCAAGIDKVAFTGSTPTGRRIMEACARTLTPVTLECGGKDAVIVAADADLAAAARAIAWGAMSNGGQTCIGVERVYVVEKVREEFVDRLCRALDGIHPGSDRRAHYGPMTTPQQVDVVRRHVEDAVRRGGRVVYGSPEVARSRYVDPVVILDPPEDSLAVQEETFGPTVTVTTVANLEDAVTRVNASKFGLGAAVFGRRDAQAVAERLDVGVVTVNSVIAFAVMPSVPMGGRRDSGFGRVHGADGLLGFTRAFGLTRLRFPTPGVDLQRLQRTRLSMAVIVRAASWLNRPPKPAPTRGSKDRGAARQRPTGQNPTAQDPTTQAKFRVVHLVRSRRSR